jgi:hypothetical protein
VLWRWGVSAVARCGDGLGSTVWSARIRYWTGGRGGVRRSRAEVCRIWFRRGSSDEEERIRKKVGPPTFTRWKPEDLVARSSECFLAFSIDKRRDILKNGYGCKADKLLHFVDDDTIIETTLKKLEKTYVMPLELYLYI